MKARRGETLKTWISRSSEVFDRCQRKCKVDFPEEARGWLTLHRSSLSDEQRAVVLARSQGCLKKESVGKAMRSCFPDYVVPRKKSFGAGIVVNEDEDPPSDTDPLTDEIEAFLAEHETAEPQDAEEVYDEQEVAEALAVSWRDKRKEITKLQRSRKFGAVGDLKKSYRVEIEELKKRTRCHKCQQVGHWSRECRAGGKSKGKGSSSGSSSTGKPSEAGAASVQTVQESFVASVGIVQRCPGSLELIADSPQSCL